uniref:Translocase of outer mitochondrial membrane 20 n=1 Tax=Sinocyclocheilus grahami TaxID=75366 RepID=A0A672L2D0_SINGR
MTSGSSGFMENTASAAIKAFGGTFLGSSSTRGVFYSSRNSRFFQNSHRKRSRMFFLFSISVFVQLPDLKDAEAVQKFFLEEIQLGEELLAQGDYEKGVDHLTNAIAVCGQPQQLLQVLQQTLPPPVFQMLLTKLPTISQVTLTDTHIENSCFK